MASQPVRFLARGESAPLLEGDLWLPEGDGRSPGVVVAHPHPQRGGSMDNNVVQALCVGLQEAGVASLRFNFRGVGRSEGVSGGGDAEPNDVLGALDFLIGHDSIDPDAIGLAGYSFGARASLAALPQQPGVRALMCVAAPLREPLPREQHPACPFIVLVGDQDGLVADGEERYASYFPDPNFVQVVPGPDHFWRGFEDIIADVARDFFSEQFTATRFLAG